ncbi:MAG: S-layer homology domain-containing protein [Nodosilinea sp.]
MVNLPPDQPSSTTSPEPRRQVRILEFDELLALVLAFLGIGSILWWGLSRSQSGLAELGLLPRREGDAAAIIVPDQDAPDEGFVPRTFERGDRPQRDIPERVTGLTGLSREPSRSDPASPRQAVSAPVVPVPVAPSTTAATTQPVDISDVPETHWAYPFIRPMYDEGYLPDFPESGFQPDQPLTRAELASLLSQAFGDVPREGTALAFEDVPDSYWAAPAIDNAVSQGFMNGYPEGDFRPDQAVPRYEVLVSLATGLGLSDSPAPDSTLVAFVDLNPLPEWARPKVAAATENSLVVNYPSRDQLKPAQAATRAEIVAMIHQALVARGALPAVPSEYAVP